MKAMFLWLLVFLSLGVLQSQQNWPSWRGSEENGVSQETLWDLSIIEPNILWKKNIGTGHSTVVVQESYLYMTGNIKNKEMVYCLQTETGEEVWRYEYDCEGGSFPGPRATPAVNDGCVYTFSRMGHIVCLDAQKGTEKWKRNLAEEWNAKAPMHGFSSSPHISGDVVIVNAGEYGFAFHKKTGEKIWSTDPQQDCGYASPVSIYQNGKRQVAVFSGKGLYILNPLTGEKIDFFAWETIYALNVCDPIVLNDEIFLCSYNEKASTLIQRKENGIQVLWENPNMQTGFSTPVAYQGYIYGFIGSSDMKSQFKCLDWKTGKEKWSQDFKYSALIAVDGKLVVLDEQGTLFIVNASPIGYEEISKCQIFKPSKIMRTWTAPVLCNGKLYLRNNLGDVVCVQLKKKAS